MARRYKCDYYYYYYGRKLRLTWGRPEEKKKRGNISHKTLTNRTPVGAPLLNRPSNLLSRFVVLHDVITHAKFGFDRFTDFRATGSQSFYFCIWKPYGPYNRLCTIVQDCDNQVSK